MSVFGVLLWLNFTSDLLHSPETASRTTFKKAIIEKDLSILYTEAASAAHLKYVHEVAINKDSSWLKVWDTAMDHGPVGTTCALAMLQVLCLRSFSELCQVPSCTQSLSSVHAGAHFLEAHSGLSQ